MPRKISMVAALPSRRAAGALGTAGALGVVGAVGSVAWTAAVARSVILTRDPGRYDREAVAQLDVARTERRVQAGDDLLHVVEWGQGRPVLLVHGYTASYGDWLPVVPALLAAGHRVVAMDLPGHGASGMGGWGPVDVDRLADAVRAVVERLDLRDAVLAGHSIGGTAVLALAARDRQLTVERVRRLVTVGAPVAIRRPAELATFASGVNPLTPALMHARRSGRALLRLQAAGHGVSPDVLDAVRRRWSGCPLPTRWAYATGLVGTDLGPQLGAVPVPVTAVVGSRDRMCPPSRGRTIAELVPQGQVEVLDGAGHLLTWERTREVTEALLAAAS